MSRQESEGLLSRWSRRKQQTQEESAREEALLDPAENTPLDAESVSGNNDLESTEPQEQPVLTDEDMPSIESLDENSDYSPFMSSGVSDRLRNLALRKMFHVPAFNIRDGLDEYDEDYTQFEALGDIVTCDMKHQIEMLEKEKREADEAAALASEEAIEDDEAGSESDEHSGSAEAELDAQSGDQNALEDQDLSIDVDSPDNLNRNEANFNDR